MKGQLKDYPFFIRPLTVEEGGGYLIEFPNLPGCMSDGETEAEAIKNGKDALKAWLDAAKKSGRTIPKPSSDYSGKWVQRVPKYLHERLALIAHEEGVSLNTLVASMIAEGIGKRL
jgi:antitoxin HicB